MKKMMLMTGLMLVSVGAMAQEVVPAETTGGVMIDVTTFGGMMALVTMFVTELCKVVAYIDQHKWAKVLCSVVVGIVLAVIALVLTLVLRDGRRKDTEVSQRESM